LKQAVKNLDSSNNSSLQCSKLQRQEQETILGLLELAHLSLSTDISICETLLGELMKTV